MKKRYEPPALTQLKLGAIIFVIAIITAFLLKILGIDIPTGNDL